MEMLARGNNMYRCHCPGGSIRSDPLCDAIIRNLYCEQVHLFRVGHLSTSYGQLPSGKQESRDRPERTRGKRVEGHESGRQPIQAMQRERGQTWALVFGHHLV